MKKLSAKLVVIFSSAVAGMIFLITALPKPKSLVVFDVTHVQSLLIRQLAEHEASDEKAMLAAQALKHSLNKVLGDYAKKHHVVIVDKAYLLSGAEDVTSTILPELSHSMRGKS